MPGTLSRVIGIKGTAPLPGQDATDAPWMTAMKRGEWIVFHYDRNGQHLNPGGKKADAEMLEVAIAFRSKFAARLAMRGAVRRFASIATVAMYDSSGRWHETRTLHGVKHRNEVLEYTKYLMQFPLAAAFGALFVIGAIMVRARFFGGLPLGWFEKTSSERASIVAIGALIGLALLRVLYYVRLQLIKSTLMPALAPIGSKEREEFYRQLESRKSDSLVPLDVELETTEIPWPDYRQHDDWAKDYQRLGFELVGSYRVLKTPSYVEFFFNAEKDLTGTISYVSTRNVGMYIDMTTRYEDGLLFSVVAKESAGLDPHPKRRSVRLPRTATLDEVFQKMLSERPQGAMVKPERELVVRRFQQSWREFAEWRRQRGTTAEEYKRIDQRRKGINRSNL